MRACRSWLTLVIVSLLSTALSYSETLNCKQYDFAEDIHSERVVAIPKDPSELSSWYIFNRTGERTKRDADYESFVFLPTIDPLELSNTVFFYEESVFIYDVYGDIIKFDVSSSTVILERHFPVQTATEGGFPRPIFRNNHSFQQGNKLYLPDWSGIGWSVLNMKTDELRSYEGKVDWRKMFFWHFYSDDAFWYIIRKNRAFYFGNSQQASEMPLVSSFDEIEYVGDDDRNLLTLTKQGEKTYYTIDAGSLVGPIDADTEFLDQDLAPINEETSRINRDDGSGRLVYMTDHLNGKYFPICN